MRSYWAFSMCIILDANCLHDLVNRSEAGLPVLEWLLNPRKQAGLIVGGKLYDELRRAGFGRRFIETLTVLSQAGRLHRFTGPQIERVTDELERGGECKSNDAHVVALALVSECNLVSRGILRCNGILKTGI